MKPKCTTKEKLLSKTNHDRPLERGSVFLFDKLGVKSYFLLGPSTQNNMNSTLVLVPLVILCTLLSIFFFKHLRKKASFGNELEFALSFVLAVFFLGISGALSIFIFPTVFF